MSPSIAIFSLCLSLSMLCMYFPFVIGWNELFEIRSKWPGLIEILFASWVCFVYMIAIAVFIAWWLISAYLNDEMEHIEPRRVLRIVLREVCDAVLFLVVVALLCWFLL